MKNYTLQRFYIILKKFMVISTIFSFSAHAGWTPYKIKDGDQVGKIIQSIGLKKWLWGQEGLVQKIASKNESKITSVDFVTINQIIYLPQSLTDLEEGPSFNNASVKRSDKEVIRNDKKVNNSDEKVKKSERVELRLGSLYSFMNRSLIDKTTNSTGTAKSEGILGIMLFSNIPISKLWSIDSSVSYRKISFASSNTRTFVVDSENFVNFSLGGKRSFGKFNFGAGIRYEQLPLVTGVAPKSVGLTSFNILSPYLKGEWNLHSWGRTNLMVQFNGAYNLSSSEGAYELTSGFDTSLAFDLRRELLKEVTFSVVPFIEFGEKETSTVEHTDFDAGLKLFLNWKL